MKERPILFSDPMVRAILDGRKTMTRRVVKRPKKCPPDYILSPHSLREAAVTWWQNPEFDRVGRSQVCPYGQPGDHLWVREAWACIGHDPVAISVPDSERFSLIAYRADDHRQPAPNSRSWRKGYAKQVGTPCGVIKWRPSIHMPRWASRINLEITDVRVERLQDISEEDAKAEGIERHAEGSAFWRDYQLKSLDGLHLPQHSFASLWDSIAASGVRWEDNPWVWAVSFRRVIQ